MHTQEVSVELLVKGGLWVCVRLHLAPEPASKDAEIRVIHHHEGSDVTGELRHGQSSDECIIELTRIPIAVIGPQHIVVQQDDGHVPITHHPTITTGLNGAGAVAVDNGCGAVIVAVHRSQDLSTHNLSIHASILLS